MAKPKPLIGVEGEVQPFSALPKDEQAMLREFGERAKRRGRPRKEDPKVPVTMRLDADVVSFFASAARVGRRV